LIWDLPITEGHSVLVLIMPLYFCPVVSFFFFILFSLPNLRDRKLDVYRTSTHGVALVQI